MEAGEGGQDGGSGAGGVPPHLPSRAWVSPGCHRPPGQPVPSTGQGREGGGEGAFLGCLGAESPPATAATRSRGDTPRPHTHSVCTAQSTQGHTRVAGYGDMSVQIHAALPLPCTWGRTHERAHAVTRVGTRSDTRSFGHAETQHPLSGSVCTQTCTHTHTTMYTHMDLGAVQARAPHKPPRTAQPRAEHPPAVTSACGDLPQHPVPGRWRPGARGAGTGKIGRAHV